MILAAPLQGSALVAHEFKFTALKPVNSVSVAGTFNSWDKQANPLVKVGNVWSATLQLSPGRHEYKFVVNGSDWIIDPSNAKSISDGNGNTNSLLIVVPVSYTGTARLGDGSISVGAVRHETRLPFIARNGDKVVIRLRTRANDVSKVHLLIGAQAVAMRPTWKDDLQQEWEAAVAISGPRLSYRFKLSDGGKSLVFGPKAGFGVAVASIPNPQVPAWAEKSVLYQIFPDRFANGDARNDRKDQAAWGSTPTYWNHFGGDFAGISKNLNYLNELGVRGIYLNPIFKSPSNHRYETSDYLNTDPELGTNTEFADLVTACHENSLKVVLDGVFNHTARDFFAFADVAKNGKTSAYTGWYHFHGFPVKGGAKPNYDAWFGYESLPKLNYGSQAVREYVFSVVNQWGTQAKIDGWRLDVPNEVADDFWPQFRRKVKGINQDAWICGEIWGDGGKWLQGDQFDSVMGYQFRSAVVDYIANETLQPSEFANQLVKTYSSYAPAVGRNLMNLLGSHDTERFLTTCKGDLAKLKIAALLQMTWPGTPCIYYGDELGLEGSKDPDNRRTMPWSKVPGNPTLGYYKDLIAARNESKALQSGEPYVLLADDSNGIFAFARVLSSEFAIIITNRSREERTVNVPVAALPKQIQASISNGLFSARSANDWRVIGKRALVVKVPAQSGLLLLSNRTHVHNPRAHRRVPGIFAQTNLL